MAFGFSGSSGGGSSPWGLNGSAIYYTSGFVGIGNNNPTHTLEVGQAGVINSTSLFTIGSDGNDFVIYSYPQDANIFRVNADDNRITFDEGNEGYHIGIGMPNPNYRFKIDNYFAVGNSELRLGNDLDNPVITMGDNGSYPLHISKTFINPTTGFGVFSDAQFTNTLDNNGAYIGGVFSATKTDDFNESAGNIIGAAANVFINGNGSIAFATGVNSYVEVAGNVTQPSITGFGASLGNTGAGIIETATGVNISIENIGAGSITTAYAFNVGSIDATNKYGFYNTTAGVINQFHNLTLGEGSSGGAINGELKFHNSTNDFTTTINASATTSDYTLTLPVDAGTANQVLSTDGAGHLSWQTIGGISGSGSADKVVLWSGASSQTYNNNFSFSNGGFNAYITSGTVNIGQLDYSCSINLNVDMDDARIYGQEVRINNLLLAQNGQKKISIGDPDNVGNGTKLIIDDGVAGQIISVTRPFKVKNYTVATLPAANNYAYCVVIVTDALLPAFLTAVVGGGAVKVPVYSDGTNWLVY